MSAGASERPRRDARPVVYRVSADVEDAERKRRLRRVYAWLLGLEPWPPDAEEPLEEGTDGSA